MIGRINASISCNFSIILGVACKVVSLYSESCISTTDISFPSTPLITLLYISENEGVTQAQLSEIHRKDRNIVSRNIDVLEEKGFVIRKRGIVDRRSFSIHLTDLGHSVISTHKNLIKESEQEVLSNLSKDEISIFYSLLTKIA